MAVSSPIELSVIIPTRDRPTLLKNCLESLEKQRAQVNFEVVIADDGRAGERVEALPSPFPVKIVRSAVRGAAAARMEAAKVARGKLLAFLDDDAVAGPEWLAAMLDHRTALLEQPIALTGRITALQDCALSRARQARYEERQHVAKARGGRCTFLAGGNSVLSADLFARTGGFDLTYPLMHDGALLRAIEQIGGHCIYEERMCIAHMHVKSSVSALVNAFRSGGYRMRLLRTSHQTVPLRQELVETLRSMFIRCEQGDMRRLNAFLNLLHLSGVGLFKLSAGRLPT